MKRFSISTLFVLTILVAFSPSGAEAAVRPLSYGMSGSDVKALQQTLIAKGYLGAGSATGHFGPLTRAAVQKFQCGSGIVCKGTAYGLVGPLTRAALAGPSSGSSSLSPSTSFEVSGWLPYWRVATSTDDVLPHLASFTSLMPFGYIVQNDGMLHDAFRLESSDATTTAAFIVAARAAGVKVVPTIMWSNGSAIHAILSDPASRAALATRIADVARTRGYDGVDIDFEGKWAETKDSFSAFLKDLHTRMNGIPIYCSIEARTPVADRYDSTPPPDATEYANDYVAINQYCHRVQLMTYDQQTVDVKLNSAASGAPYIPIADPKWVEKVVTLAAETIAKDKLMIGVATYGYEWQVTPLSVSGYRYDMQWAFNPRYAVALAAALGLTPSRNTAGEISFTYQPSAASAVAGGAAPAAATTYSDTGTTPATSSSYNILWLSDATAIAQKIALAQRLGVRGIAIFKLDGGEDPGLWNVLPTTH